SRRFIKPSLQSAVGEVFHLDVFTLRALSGFLGVPHLHSYVAFCVKGPLERESVGC
ncbi:hypothetical protein KUCAC02_035529, partial [Chaenocephalus aceratus]